jgi:dipeptidyl aminopeptidase/acylaminoacyl peptidase
MAGERRGYQVEDLYRLKTVTDPQISPDGRQVAYVVGEIDREGDGYRSAIWLVAVDGSGARRLTYSDRGDTQPRWSPDGRALAFVSNRTGSNQLYVLPITGGEPRRLTDLPRGVSEIAWSPDGTAIAFTARTGGDDRAGAPRVLTALKHKLNGQGFFDGSRLHLFVVDATEPGAPRQITDGDWDDGQIAWSPDGRLIAFVSARHESRDRDQGQDVWVVPAAGGEARCLTNGFGPCQAPAFSPDGRTIAFAGHADRHDLGGRTSRVWLVPVAGGAPRALTAALDRGVQAGPLTPGAPPARIAWTPNGGAVLARVQDGADVHLYRAAVPDGTLTRLVGGERCVLAFSTAADGTLALLITNPYHPAEVFVAAPDGTAARRLTATNDALLDELRLPEIAPARATMPDGAVIEGWVIKPLDMEPGARYPLVLDVHGGPHGAFLHAFAGAYPLALASRGCAVLQVNPRGSTGWGEEFARHLHGGRGERDLPELLAVLDTVIAQGWVDPERLGITGYSYGGYMTAWAIGHTDRFKAAVWGAGAANLYTHFAYSDINAPRYHEMDGSPWERRELYLRLSPISYVQHIRTPLLMLHGEADLRCNIAQADEFFTALKYLGNEVVLVRYPGEHHGMRQQGKPSNRVDYDRRLIAWFAERLAFDPTPAVAPAAAVPAS